MHQRKFQFWFDFFPPSRAAFTARVAVRQSRFAAHGATHPPGYPWNIAPWSVPSARNG
jgi:hypothetical protein